MELKLNRETVPAAEVIFDGVQEQSVELDYILPDYCPDIFRLIRCDTSPVITEWSVSGDRLTYELRCDIHILYCGEDGSEVQSVDQHRSFTKTVELGRSPVSPQVRLTPKTDHVNFRAVNKRRLDLRGAVSVKISVTGQQEQQVVSDAEGMNIQLKRRNVEFAASRLSAEKNVRIEEEMELSAAQPDISGILRCSCTAAECEVKLISGKLLAKGEPLNDDNIVYSIHTYEPFVFTHQSANWTDLKKVKNLMFPYDKEKWSEFSADFGVTKDLPKWYKDAIFNYNEIGNKEYILNLILPAKEWAVKNNVPVIINEFGAYNLKTDKQSVLNYMTAMREISDTLEIPLTHWGYTGGFSLFESTDGVKGTKLIEGMAEAYGLDK